MPHGNPPPSMARMEPQESELWATRIKAVPFNSPNFNCIIPGCPNSYQTKQGLERHFAAIHMYRADPNAKYSRSTSAASIAGNTFNSMRRNSGSGTRNGRVRSRRKGRPPGSGLKARLKQQEIEQALEQAITEGDAVHRPEIHTNHSLLASHAASARHDCGDDEAKPREERSYLEFFPFLNTSLRLELVDASQMQSQTLEGSSRTSAPEADDLSKPGTKSTAVKTEGSVLDTAPIPPTTNDHKEHTITNDIFHDSINELPNETSASGLTNTLSSPVTEIVLADQNHPGDSNVDDNMDGDAASDRDEFFDAKGFIESEAESSQKQVIQHERSASRDEGRSVSPGTQSEVRDETMDMDVDQEGSASTNTDIANADVEETSHDYNVSAMQEDDVKMVPEPEAQDSKSAERSSFAPSTNAHSTGLSAKQSTAQSITTALEPKTPATQLPQSSFRLIPRDDDDLEEYHLPAGHNVRYIEPTETELAERVEYDMDEQDEFWLKDINAERRKQDLGEVSASMFEKIIDRLEKEWFDLTKNIPKSTENLPPEDSACNICDDGECENSNAIVFCDGCNLAVHQDCYGIPYIPEGQWLCRKCMLSPQMPVSCIFCPGEGGAFKQTTNSRWAHLLCASWIPEVGVANTVYMEPIDNIDKIPASRWRLTCYICKLRMGACIQCETKNCFRAFHVTCARRAHLYMKSKLSKASNSGGEVLVYRAHCHKHTPRDYRGAVDIAGAAALFAHKGIKKKRAKIRVVDDDSEDPDYGRSDEEEISGHGRSSVSNNDTGATTSSALVASQSLGGSRTSKAALAHQKHYTPGAPLAPMFIVNRLLPFVGKLGAKTPALRKVSALNFIYTVCKYWSLKRESRRGAPLLKRLHLEPWTASASAHRQTEEEKVKKLQTQLLLRGDLEKVRMLAELVRKRERAKLKRQELQNRYLCKIIFPLKTILEDTLAELEKLDRQKFFAYPISAEEVKDYHDVIKNPICFQTMNENVFTHEYQSVEEFADDARRIYHNCLTYNKVDTPYYRAATRQLKQAEPLLQKAKEDYEHLEIDPQTGFLAVPIDPEIFTYNLVPFQRPEEEGERQLSDVSVPATQNVVPTEINPPKSKRRNPSVDLPRLPVVTGRPLRATSGRAGQTAGSLASLASTTASNSQKSAQEAQQALNKTPGFRSPSRNGPRPEVPKLKTATLTRADVAKARQASSDGTVQLSLDEDELLEKLKHKSKKSRSLAVNLQSRLKPSIVDKAVVINKPAPKGWAYVVVEGEEDTTEGEDEVDSKEGELDEETQALEKAKEEARIKRREERHALALKKKLAKGQKAKARAEAYARLKASRATGNLAQAEKEGASGKQDSQGSHSQIEIDSTLPLRHSSQGSRNGRSRSRRSAADQRSKGAADSIADHDDQEGPVDLNKVVDGGDLRMTSTSTPHQNSQNSDSETEMDVKEHETHGKGKQTGRHGADLSNGVDGLGLNSEGQEPKSDDDDDASVPVEDEVAAMDEDPMRKRQRRPASSRVAARDVSEDESATGSTRRLRSTDAAPLMSVSLGTRRESSASQRNDITGKRRRSESIEGSPKKLKSDRHGGPLSYGSLVWAKMEGFPWFPAELMDPKGPQVPDQAREMKKEGHGVHLVQFFDLRERGERGRSWYWVTTAQLSPLGVDLDEDRKRVHIKAGWNPKRRKTVKQAYIDACQLKGIDPSLVLTESS
ncbi:hypothetical protein BC939DRAFT_161255 [Gamsiella multidivaricata]|uniref:uncharacterized protein n=1 Tax=Gamsiella multidivaricata TaxID=101098 RepID=UPI002220051A|nr:uncharacterized protein BC939DRAFT_161255 [Gamsiella multidivaricata]KAI7823613.1 hypothetical protein BC939DRAFT_161255 [Gamsiella multidivaricata]